MNQSRNFSTLYNQIPGFESPEIEVTKEGALFKNLVASYGFSKPIIESYNYWITYILPNQIMAESIPTREGIIRYVDIEIDLPTLEKEPLTPKMCRDRNLTYEAVVKGRPYYQDKVDGRITHVGNVNILFRLPIMLGSCKCVLQNMTDDEKIMAGEAPDDPLGYFIINGTCKVIITQEKLRTFIHRFISHDYKYEGKITCKTATGTSVVSMVIGKKSESIKIGISKNSFQKENHHIPLYIAFFVLGFKPQKYRQLMDSEDNEEIIGNFYQHMTKLILQFCDEADKFQVYQTLQTSLLKSKNVSDIIDYVCGKRGLTVNANNRLGSYELARNDILNNLFAHIETEEKKGLHLAFMASNMVRVLLGKRPLDDRDSWSNKRLAVPATLFEILIGDLWKKMLVESKTAVKDMPSKDIKNLVNTANVKRKNLTDELIEAFQADKWGVKKSRYDTAKKENVTDTMRMETPISIVSQLRLVNTPSGRQGKQLEIRKIHPTSVGYLCIAETPEGSNCGLLKSFAVLCNISMDRSTDDVIELLKDENLQSYFSVDYVEGWIPFLLNGQFYGYVPEGDESDPLDIMGRHKTMLEQVLQENKRTGFLPRDCCINYNYMDRIVEYYCDGARPIRLLLVVEDEQLVIDKLSMWESSIEDLFNHGCIEFVDAREQEFNLLAKSPDDVRSRFSLKSTLQKIIDDDKRYDILEKQTLDKLANMINNPIDYLQRVCQRLITFYTQHYDDLLFDSIVINVWKCFSIYIDQLAYQYTSYKLKLIPHFIPDVIIGVAMELCNQFIDDIIDKMYPIVDNEYPNLINDIIATIGESDQYDVSEEIRRTMRNIFETLQDRLDDINSKIPYTHSEIMPLAVFGISGALEPKPDCEQGPRVTYQASMSKQALGRYHYNHHLRFDTGFKVFSNPQRTMFETLLSENAYLNTCPTGTAPICAYLCLRDNNEDAIITKQEYINGINLDLVKYTTHKMVISKNTKLFVEKLCIPGLRPGESKDRYRAIGFQGLPKLDMYIRYGDCIIGKSRTDLVTKEEHNRSIFAGIGEEGYVDRILVTTNSKGEIMVKVKIRQFRKHVSGDKVASRYAQKGTLSFIIPERELPRIQGGINDELVPDFFINPMSLPSRMTLGKMKEILSSKIALYTGERVDATSFTSFDVHHWEDKLRNLNQKELNLPANDPILNMYAVGEEIMAWPDGQVLEVPVFSGPCTYQPLKHHAKDKIQVRSRGAIKAITHQPIDGRSNNGGLRIGEMERDAFVAHGVTGIILERLMKVSDAYTVSYCRTCGNISIPTEDKTCRICNSKNNFGASENPYILKLVIHCLLSMQINVTMKFKNAYDTRVEENQYLL